MSSFIYFVMILGIVTVQAKIVTIMSNGTAIEFNTIAMLLLSKKYLPSSIFLCSRAANYEKISARFVK